MAKWREILDSVADRHLVIGLVTMDQTLQGPIAKISDDGFYSIEHPAAPVADLAERLDEELRVTTIFHDEDVGWITIIPEVLVTRRHGAQDKGALTPEELDALLKT